MLISYRDLEIVKAQRKPKVKLIVAPFPDVVYTVYNCLQCLTTSYKGGQGDNTREEGDWE
jgi:hypothetical protein